MWRRAGGVKKQAVIFQRAHHPALAQGVCALGDEGERPIGDRGAKPKRDGERFAAKLERRPAGNSQAGGLIAMGGSDGCLFLDRTAGLAAGCDGGVGATGAVPRLAGPWLYLKNMAPRTIARNTRNMNVAPANTPSTTLTFVDIRLCASIVPTFSLLLKRGIAKEADAPVATHGHPCQLGSSGCVGAIVVAARFVTWEIVANNFSATKGFARKAWAHE